MKYLLSQIAEICGGELIGADCEVNSIVTDSRSRSVGCGELFVAMRGVNHDSHQFIDDMLRRGVRCFMCEQRVSLCEGSYILVQSAINSLQRLAAHHRQGFSAEVVAVTGSNGKTTIKEWIAQSTPQNISLFRSPRSYNSQLGVALSLLMARGDEDVVVIEAGISRPKEMSRLETMIRPNTVIFTSIGDAHSEGFNSMQQKIEEKMILCQRAKRLIYHGEEREITTLLPSIETIDAAGFKGGEFTDVASCRNSQIVEAFCSLMHYPTPSFESLRPVAMRLELREGINDSVILNDSYNCDINSLSIAIDQLKWVASGRKMTLILSDILQSALPKEELYRRVGEILRTSQIDTLIGVGRDISSYAKFIDCKKRLFATTEELINRLSREDYASRAILLKGNRESRFENISHTLSLKSHTTTLEVDLDAMTHNLNYFRSHLRPTTKLTAMVKASSYGAGEYEIAQTLQHQGVDYLAVAFTDEGVRLRERGITMPIIVLNADDGSFSQMIASRLEPEIYSLKSLHTFATEVQRHSEREYPIHLKLDSGMHRLGFSEGDIEKIGSIPSELRIASIFSHLSSADIEGEEGATHLQMQRFESMCNTIKSQVKYPILCHILNSAGIIRFPEYQADMCRLGIGLYGFGVGKGVIPISTLKSKIVQIKEYSQPSSIGYAKAGKIDGGGRVATIPVGYADGLDRHLGCGAWSVIIAGQRAPIIGRICMDSCMVDISHIAGVEEGEEVIILSNKEGNTAEDMANILGTIPYEVLTSISSRVKRIYIKE